MLVKCIFNSRVVWACLFLTPAGGREGTRLPPAGLAAAPVPRQVYWLGMEKSMPTQRHCVVQVGELKVPAGGREETHWYTTPESLVWDSQRERHMWLFSPVIQDICLLFLCINKQISGELSSVTLWQGRVCPGNITFVHSRLSTEVLLTRCCASLNSPLSS